MPAKLKTKRAVSPFARGNVATCIDPILGSIETRYIIDISDFEEVVMAMLPRIYLRDGEKVFDEAARIVKRDLASWIAATKKYKGWKHLAADRTVDRRMTRALRRDGGRSTA